MEIQQQAPTLHFTTLYQLCEDNNANIEQIKTSYLNLLNKLTFTPDITNDLFIQQLKKIDEMGLIIVCTNTNTIDENFKIIGSGTVIIEPKIIRGGKSVGHIEDIVVDERFRGRRIAQTILHMLKEFARKNNCYKVILDCYEEVCHIYTTNGFEIKGTQMAQYL